MTGDLLRVTFETTMLEVAEESGNGGTGGRRAEDEGEGDFSLLSDRDRRPFSRVPLCEVALLLSLLVVLDLLCEEAILFWDANARPSPLRVVVSARAVLATDLLSEEEALPSPNASLTLRFLGVFVASWTDPIS